MNFNIGKLSIGLRYGAKDNWKKYLLPRETQGKNHCYFKFGIWWLGFYMYYPRHCPTCKQWMPTTGGTKIYNSNGNTLFVICKKCHEDIKRNF